MVFENIEIQQANFCIAPLIGTYGSINTINSITDLQFKNDSGDSSGSFTLNPSYPIDTEIQTLTYLGPNNLIALVDDLPFITLVRNNSNSCGINLWGINTTSSRLDLKNTITKTSTSQHRFDCYASAVGTYRVSLTSDVEPEYGQLALNSTVGMQPGGSIYLGPSTHPSYVEAFEVVTILDIIDEYTVTISGTSNSEPIYGYSSDDSAVGIGNIYLFSDLGEYGDTTKGTLYTLDFTTGNILDVDYSAIYKGITAATYGTPYHNTVAVVKTSELLYISVDDYIVKKSNRINVVKSNRYDYLDIFDIDISSSSIYRLQDAVIKRSDTGGIAEITWDEYNFQEDAIASFTDSVSLYAGLSGILSNTDTVTIYVVVMDQYGVGLSGKTVHFDKESGDTNGVWGDVNQEGITDINGTASITYTSGWFDPDTKDGGIEDITITAYTDGSNILTGSIYVWAKMVLNIRSKFFIEPEYSGIYKIPALHTLRQYVDTWATSAKCTQKYKLSTSIIATARTKFQNPGGDWVLLSPPGDTLKLIKQLKTFESELKFDAIANDFNSTTKVKQKSQASHNGRVSQNHVSRHLPAGSNEDDVEIAQFRFISQAVPTPFSEKNNVNSTIWVRLLPESYSLNKDTLVFRVREVSYKGDTGYIDMVGTPYLTVSPFEISGPGSLLGVEVLYEPPAYFHNNGIVYVDIEIYDNAIPKNRIDFDYWFTVIADYRAPYIVNEYPVRNSTDITVDSNISFDVLDNEVGVDINTLDFYVNNRIKSVNITTISGGYNVVYNPIDDFYFKQQVEVSIRIQDSSENQNILYDMWRFTCEESFGPMIDAISLTPELCVKGVNSRQTVVGFNIYDIGTGIEDESVRLLVDNKEVPVTKYPLIYRV